MKIRSATLLDCGLVWVWANDPIVRLNSFNQAFIPWLTHIDWFRKRLDDVECLFYIVTDDEDNPIAQARFDREGDEAEISVMISAGWRGKGHGGEIIRISSMECPSRKIVARVKFGNIPSLKAFEKAGYVKSGVFITNKQLTTKLILDKGEVVSDA